MSILWYTWQVMHKCLGGLEKCAAWKFENYMQILKRKVGSGKKSFCSTGQTHFGIRRSRFFTPKAEQNTLQAPKCLQNFEWRLLWSGRLCQHGRKELSLSGVSFPFCNFPAAMWFSYFGVLQNSNTNYQIKSLTEDVLVTRYITYHSGRHVTFLPLLHEF